VYVPQGTFAASKDEMKNGPSNFCLSHLDKQFIHNPYTHNTQVGAPETVCQSQIRFNYKALDTENQGHVDGNVSSSVSCNLQMS
jgi:hypothetical protein